MSEWISVEDTETRPELEKPYVVAIRAGFLDGQATAYAKWIGDQESRRDGPDAHLIGEWWLLDAYGMAHTVEDPDDDDSYRIYVTHWMPLPDPPEVPR
jgi:hypothetical protein